jgi:hypothetical protein
MVLGSVALGAPAASAVPPPVLPHVPPIAATFTLHPDSGPVGTKVTIQGVCGFAASQLLYGVSVQTEDGFQLLWLPTEFATLKQTPIGAFSVSFTFPSVGNVSVDSGGLGNVPIEPGTYYVGAACAPPTTLMPFEPFTVTGQKRG